MLRDVLDWPEARLMGRRLNVALGETLANAGRHREAVDPWSRAMALCEGVQRLACRMERACCLAYAGDAEKALAEAELVAKEPHHLKPGDWYNLACVASLAAESSEKDGSPELPEEAAVRAFRWLNQARDLQLFRDPEVYDQLKKSDGDLEYLRSRPDFKLLVLDAAFPTDPFRSGR